MVLKIHFINLLFIFLQRIMTTIIIWIIIIGVILFLFRNTIKEKFLRIKLKITPLMTNIMQQNEKGKKK
jgi:small-conductance mechanosensitive channel